MVNYPRRQKSCQRADTGAAQYIEWIVHAYIHLCVGNEKGPKITNIHPAAENRIER